MEHASPSPPRSSRADLIGSESPVTAEAAERFIEAATQVAIAQWCRACCSSAFRRWSTRFLWLDRVAVRADALFFWREATRAFAAILHAADAHRRSKRLQQKYGLRRAQRWVRWRHGVRAGCARLEQASRQAAVFGVRWLTRRTLRVWQRRRQLRRVAIGLSQVKLRHLQGEVACCLRRWLVHCRREALRRDAHRSELHLLLLRWRSRAASKASRESASVQTQRATRQARLEDATREWRLLCARMAARSATLATAKSAAAGAAFRQMRTSLRKIAQRRVCEELCFHERRHRHLGRTLAALSDWVRLLAEKRAAAAAWRASADGLWLRHAAARWRRHIADLRARLRALCTQEAALVAVLTMLRTRRLWSRWRRWRNVGRDQLRRRWPTNSDASADVTSRVYIGCRSCRMSRALVALDFAAAARRAEQPLETLSSLLAMRHNLLALAIATHRLRAHSQWRLFCIPHRSACLRRWLKRWMEVVAAMLSSYVRRHAALVQVHRRFELHANHAGGCFVFSVAPLDNRDGPAATSTRVRHSCGEFVGALSHVGGDAACRIESLGLESTYIESWVPDEECSRPLYQGVALPSQAPSRVALSRKVDRHPPHVFLRADVVSRLVARTGPNHLGQAKDVQEGFPCVV
ncbi:hypothetical protein AB1Y20_018757 [Prymnesium parvum]|uniref:Uncharacterized protein n=1 Tax=Prymnesium parvum TaxID=97485 RepID=A0AB34JPL9_PRYPA